MGVQVPPPAPMEIFLNEEKMDFKEIENKKLVRSYEFTIEYKLLDQKVDEKLEKARLNFQMKGFRKGVLL